MKQYLFIIVSSLLLLGGCDIGINTPKWEGHDQYLSFEDYLSIKESLLSEESVSRSIINVYISSHNVRGDYSSGIVIGEYTTNYSYTWRGRDSDGNLTYYAKAIFAVDNSGALCTYLCRYFDTPPSYL